MTKRLYTFLFALVWLGVMIACLFLTLRATIASPDYFSERYEQIGIEAATGIPQEDCTRAVFRLVEYMEGRVDSIQLSVTENGQTVQMYNGQEIEHMVDVRALYQGFRVFSWLALGAFALMLALGAWKKELGALAIRAYSWAIALLILAVLGLGAWVLLDFNSFWIGFHRLFFTNELWLMDPAVCRMIRICPIELFYGIVVRTGLVFVCIFIALPLVGRLIARRLAKRRSANGGRNEA